MGFRCSDKIQLLKSENEVFQREQDRLTEIQARTLSEARKREQELRRQVKLICSHNIHSLYHP